MVPKIIATADLHGTLPELPPADIIIVAGDVCPIFDHSPRFQLGWLDTNFRTWLESLTAPYVVGIAGNHDFVFETNPEDVAKLKLPWHYLQDRAESFLTLGPKGSTSLNIYGTPWVPKLKRWAFYDDSDGLNGRFRDIPNDIDIVVSHGPPLGYRDLTVPDFGSEHAGFPGANDMLERVKPRALVCGHIHEGYGVARHPSGATVYNVALNTADYEPVQPPVVVKF